MTSRSGELPAGLGHHPLREARDRRLRQVIAHYGLLPEQRPRSTSKPKPGYTPRGMPRLYKPGRDHAFSFSRQAYSYSSRIVLAARQCVAWFDKYELDREHHLFPPLVERCRAWVAAYLSWFKAHPEEGRCPGSFLPVTHVRLIHHLAGAASTACREFNPAHWGPRDRKCSEIHELAWCEVSSRLRRHDQYLAIHRDELTRYFPGSLSIVRKADLWPVTDEELHASTPPNILAKITVELL